MGLVGDPYLGSTIEAWDLGLVLDPVPWVEGWRLVGAPGPKPEDQDHFVCLPRTLAQNLGVSAG